MYQNASERWSRMVKVEFICCIRVYLNAGAEWGKWNLHVVSECISTLVQNGVNGIHILRQSISERWCRSG